MSSGKELEHDLVGRIRPSDGSVMRAKRRAASAEASRVGLETLWAINILGNQAETLAKVWFDPTPVEDTYLISIKDSYQALISRLHSSVDPDQPLYQPRWITSRYIAKLREALILIGKPIDSTGSAPADEQLRLLINKIDACLGSRLGYQYTKSFAQSRGHEGKQSDKYTYVVKTTLGMASEIISPSLRIPDVGYVERLTIRNRYHSAQMDAVLTPCWVGRRENSLGNFVEMVSSGRPWSTVEVKVLMGDGSRSNARESGPLSKHAVSDLRDQFASLVLWWRDHGRENLPLEGMGLGNFSLPTSTHFIYLVPFVGTHHHDLSIDRKFLDSWWFTIHDNLIQLEQKLGGRENIIKYTKIADLYYLEEFISKASGKGFWPSK